MFKKKKITKRHLRRRVAIHVQQTINQDRYQDTLHLNPRNYLISNVENNLVVPVATRGMPNSVRNVQNNDHAHNLENNANGSISSLFNSKLSALSVYSVPIAHSSTTDAIKHDAEPLAELNFQASFLQKFKSWAIRNNVTHKSMNELLPIISTGFPFLKTDARTILGTPKTLNVIPLDNGEMIYCGIKSGLLRKLENGLVSEETAVIKMQFNIDGIPLFNSSKLQFWPILGRSLSLKNTTPYPIAIFCGPAKPEPLSEYLNMFVEELETLLNFGFIYLNKTYVFEIECFSCDAPARAFIKQVKGHTSKSGCERCNIKSIFENKRHFYPITGTWSCRNDEDFFNNVVGSEHIVAQSPLVRLNIGLVTQFVLDPMHLLYLGVTKRLLLLYWLEGKRPWKLPKFSVHNINAQIKSIRKYIPQDFPRKIRTLDDVKRWKATEYRFFLLYCGPLLLRKDISTSMYKHFLLLHSASFILSNKTFIDSFFNVAKTAIENFVKNSTVVYDKFFNVYNIHSLLHLCDDVRLYGSIENYSCFGFESCLGALKRQIRSKRLPLQQIYNRLKEIELNTNTERINQNEMKPLGVYDRQSDNYFKCSKLKTSTFVVSTKFPDNIVTVKKNTISNTIYKIDSIIFMRNQYKFIGTSFRYLENFYKAPIESSKLGIYFAKGTGSQQIFSLDDIEHKNISFPYKDGYYVAPILHQLK